MNFKAQILILFLSFTFYLQAQEQDSTLYPQYYEMIVNGEDTIFFSSYLDELELVDYKPLSAEDQRRYYRLRKKVLKVYPYALEASNQYVEVNDELSDLKRRRKKKRYSKKKMKWIKENFQEELKKLKRSEGRILVKLLHRNLQVTAYDLVKEYKNGLSARFWQSFASFYSIDLKAEYDPLENDDDRLIERIIQKAIMDGLIEESKLSPYQLIRVQKK